MNKFCNHCKDIKKEENDSLATQMLKAYQKQATRWFVIAIVILSMWLSTIGIFVWYIQLYDYETYEISADDDGFIWEYKE